MANPVCRVLFFQIIPLHTWSDTISSNDNYYHTYRGTNLQPNILHLTGTAELSSPLIFMAFPFHPFHGKGER